MLEVAEGQAELSTSCMTATIALPHCHALKTLFATANEVAQIYAMLSDTEAMAAQCRTLDMLHRFIGGATDVLTLP